MSRNHTPPRAAPGFALSEVLVAAALLAVGLLGQLALLVQGLRTERAAASLATAVTVAADLGERLRANPVAALLYVVDPETPSPATACALATPFDAATRAACDLAEWRREADAALPGAEVQVDAVNVEAAVTHCTITIRWSTPGSQRGEYTLRVQV